MFATYLSMVLMTLNVADEAQELAARQEAALAKIRTIRVSIDTKESKDGGQNWKTLGTDRVILSGRKELVRSQEAGTYYQGTWVPGDGEQATLYGPSEVRGLAISPKGGGDIKHPVMQGPIGWGNSWKARLLLSPYYNTCQEWVKNCKVRDVKSSDEAHGPTRIVTLEPKGDRVFRLFQVHFATARGSLISKVEFDYVEADGPDKTKIHRGHWDVLEFQELASGGWFPKVVQTSRDDVPGQIARFETRDLVCNQPIEDQEFDLPFPPGIVVVDRRSSTYHIWGEGKPARTFKTPSEFGEWNRARQREAAAQRPFYARAWVIGVAACLVALLVLLAARRRLVRLQAQPN